MALDTELNRLILNKMTPEQFAEAKANGSLSSTELYLVDDCEEGNLPSGGVGASEDKWELLVDVTLESDVKIYTHQFDYPQKKLKVIINTPAADADTTYSGFSVYFNNEAGTPYLVEQMVYPMAIPRKAERTSVYDISTYYLADVPCVEMKATTFENAKYADMGTGTIFSYAENLAEPYYGKIMVPEIVKFSQNTYGTFAAGTHYRIYGVKA